MTGSLFPVNRGGFHSHSYLPRSSARKGSKLWATMATRAMAWLLPERNTGVDREILPIFFWLAHWANCASGILVPHVVGLFSMTGQWMGCRSFTCWTRLKCHAPAWIRTYATRAGLLASLPPKVGTYFQRRPGFVSHSSNEKAMSNKNTAWTKMLLSRR